MFLQKDAVSNNTAAITVGTVIVSSSLEEAISVTVPKKEAHREQKTADAAEDSVTSPAQAARPETIRQT